MGGSYCNLVAGPPKWLVEARKKEAQDRSGPKTP